MKACPQCGGAVGPLPDPPAPATPGENTSPKPPLAPRPEPETELLVVSEVNKPLALMVTTIVAVGVYFGWGQLFPPQSSFMSDRGPQTVGSMVAAGVCAGLTYLAMWGLGRRVTRVRK